LTIPQEAGSRRLRCPKCATRFYPDGEPSAKSPGPASSFLATARESPRSRPKPPPAEKKPAPPPKGREAVAPPPLDLRDMLDIPLVPDSHDLPPRPAGVADAAALFRDDPPADRRKKALAEAKREARRCPSCGSVILSGMSLCDRCGLDLDTGQRYEMIEEEFDDAPPPMAVEGPPAAVLVIGIVALVAGLFLAALSLFQLPFPGPLLLTPVCLFGALAGLQFLRGKALKLMIVALMLGGGVDLVALIIMPIVMADENVDGMEKSEVTAKSETESALPKPITERLDYTKVTLGVGIILMDAMMLITISTPGVRHYFERRRQSLDEGYIQP
jgi:hypothetical protein